MKDLEVSARWEVSESNKCECPHRGIHLYSYILMPQPCMPTRCENPIEILWFSNILAFRGADPHGDFVLGSLKPI